MFQHTHYNEISTCVPNAVSMFHRCLFFWPPWWHCVGRQAGRLAQLCWEQVGEVGGLAWWEKLLQISFEGPAATQI